jgi:hypothetical protein
MRIGLTVSLTAMAILGFAVASHAANDDRFPQAPAEFLVDPSNALLRAAIEEDQKSLDELEKGAVAKGGFQDPIDLLNHAVALLAIGKVKEAEESLNAAAAHSGTDRRLLLNENLVRVLVLLRESNFASASRVGLETCSDNAETTEIKQICRLLLAQVSSLSGNQTLARTATQQLHKDAGIIQYPESLIPREATWDAVRVADYVVLKHFDEALWATYDQDWQRTRVRKNYINRFDFVTHSSSFSDAWPSLEQLIKFEFSVGNYEAASNWLYEYDIEAMANHWQQPIQQYGYTARTDFMMGNQKEAEDALRDAEDWINETFKTQTRRYFAWLDFSETFNVAGLEQLTNPRLDKIWNDTSTLSDVDSQLVAFEVGFRLLQNYSRIAVNRRGVPTPIGELSL